MTTTETLTANICYMAEDLLRAKGNAESASIPMGEKRILIGPPSELARMLGYSDTLAIFAATKRATRFWSGVNAAGHLAQLWTVEPRAEDYPHLTITAHVTMPLVREGDAAPSAAAVTESQPADELAKALEEALKVIDDYLDYEHNGDPWTEDARTMGEMDINDYGCDGRMESARAILAEHRAALQAPVPAAADLRPGIERAAQHLEMQAVAYLHAHAGTDPSTGAIVFHYGDAGRDHHSTLVELAEEIRALALPAAPATSDKAEGN